MLIMRMAESRCIYYKTRHYLFAYDLNKLNAILNILGIY